MWRPCVSGGGLLLVSSLPSNMCCLLVRHGHCYLNRLTADMSCVSILLHHCLRTQEELLVKLRSEPGLLSWNVSTLVNRIISASQMLKLTPELSLTLLSYHRPLINVVSLLPQRLEALRKLLGVPGGL